LATVEAATLVLFASGRSGFVVPLLSDWRGAGRTSGVGLASVALAGSDARGAPVGRIVAEADDLAAAMAETEEADVGVTEPLGAVVVTGLVAVSFEAAFSICFALSSAADAVDVAGFVKVAVVTTGFLKAALLGEAVLVVLVEAVLRSILGVSALTAGRPRSPGEGTAAAATLGTALN
jgi:hypothetical protein